MGAIGVAINGVPIYNPFAAEGHLGVPNVDALKVEAFDSCCGHPNPQEYHYHQYPACLRLLGSVNNNQNNNHHHDGPPPSAEAIVRGLQEAFRRRECSPLLGWMLDGFPIFGPLGEDASGRFTLLRSSYTGPPDAHGNPTYVAGSGDLDACNGLRSRVPGSPFEHLGPIYHYVLPLVGEVVVTGDGVEQQQEQEQQQLRIATTTQTEQLAQWHGKGGPWGVTYSGPPLTVCRSAFPHTTVVLRGAMAQQQRHGKGDGKGGGKGYGKGGKGKGMGKGKGKGKGKGNWWQQGALPDEGPPPDRSGYERGYYTVTTGDGSGRGDGWWGGEGQPAGHGAGGWWEWEGKGKGGKGSWGGGKGKGKEKGWGW